MLENDSNRDVKRVLVSPVVEVDKVFKGMQSNLIINAIFLSIRKSKASDFKMQLSPVNYIISKLIILNNF